MFSSSSSSMGVWVEVGSVSVLPTARLGWYCIVALAAGLLPTAITLRARYFPPHLFPQQEERILDESLTMAAITKHERTSTFLEKITAEFLFTHNTTLWRHRTSRPELG
jgi:hypothetical protein